METGRYCIYSKDSDGLAEALKDLPCGAVVSVIGAGGKTTTVHQLAHYYRLIGRRVLVTTTTHMHPEPPCLKESSGIIRELEEHGYVFASGIEKKGEGLKACSLPAGVLREVIPYADLTVIEADGARCMPFKVPKPTEPVIDPATTHIVLVAGMKAVGHPAGEVTYNPDGFEEDLTVTPGWMAGVYRKTFLRRMAAEHPAIPLIVLAGQADTPGRQAYAKEFLEALTL